MNKEFGARSKHRKDLATRVTKGLPPQFCQDVLGFKSSYLRKSRQRQRDDSTLPALVTESRTDTSGRMRWVPEYEQEVARFFESRTQILSGANTHTRKLLMNKGRLEIEFEAQYPAILKKVVELEPSIRPDPTSNTVLSRLQQDVLAAEFAAEQDNFCDAEEYKTRLEAALERLVKNNN